MFGLVLVKKEKLRYLQLDLRTSEQEVQTLREKLVAASVQIDQLILLLNPTQLAGLCSLQPAEVPAKKKKKRRYKKNPKIVRPMGE